MERSGWKPSDDLHHPHHPHICPNCPRCGCSNTKFCYYNNYSLTQPRYFCKGCRRYWTKGGSLRNVPVGGGCRKNRRGSSRALRVSTNTTTGNNNVHGGCSIGQNSYGNINPLLAQQESSSCGVVNKDQDASPRIDLAAVYANYLNQKPDSKSSGGSDHYRHHHELPELPCGFDPGLDFSSCIGNMNINVGSSSSSVQLMEDNNGLIGSDNMYFGGLEPLIDDHHHQTHQVDHRSDLVEYASSTTTRIHESSHDFGLPPLPEQEILWSNRSHDHHQMMVSPIMQPTSVLGSEAHDNRNHLNWSPVFDLPCNGTYSST